MVDLGSLDSICCASRMPVLWDASCEGDGLSCRRHAFARCERVPLSVTRRSSEGSSWQCQIAASCPSKMGSIWLTSRLHQMYSISISCLTEFLGCKSRPEECKRLGCRGRPLPMSSLHESRKRHI